MLMTLSQQVFLALRLSGTFAQVFIGNGSSDITSQLQSGVPDGLSAACRYVWTSLVFAPPMKQNLQPCDFN